MLRGLAVTFPRCQCGGEPAPPLRVVFDSFAGKKPTRLEWRARAVPAVTEAEEAEANAYEDAAIVQCRSCSTRIVLHAERPERYRGNKPIPDQSVFEVSTPQGETKP